MVVVVVAEVAGAAALSLVVVLGAAACRKLVETGDLEVDGPENMLAVAVELLEPVELGAYDRGAGA